MLPLKDVINTKQQLKEWLKDELPKYKVGKIKYLFQLGEAAILCKHQKILRKTEYYVNTGNVIMAVVYKVRLSKIQNKYSLHIPVNCCGKGLHIMHLGPILINNKVKIGENCSLHINTSFVAQGVNNNVPTIGNGVVVGGGAVVLGGIYVADNVAIGANAVVNKDILEENIAVAGVPAKKVSDNGSLKWN